MKGMITGNEAVSECRGQDAVSSRWMTRPPGVIIGVRMEMNTAHQMLKSSMNKGKVTDRQE